MNESDYHNHVLPLFGAIEARLEKNDADFDNHGDVIEIVTDDDEKIIINKQTPMREVWVASREGGRHFRHADGEWRDTRDGTPLLDYLDGLLGRL